MFDFLNSVIQATFACNNVCQCALEVVCLNGDSWYDFTLCLTINKCLLQNDSAWHFDGYWGNKSMKVH